jgi:hypothetical protein
MKKLVIIVLFIGLMFSLAMAEEIERVEFNINGDFFEQITTISVLKEEIIKENTLSYYIKNKLNVLNDSLYYQDAVQNPGKEIIVYDNLKIVGLFLPKVEQTKLSTVFENQEIDTNLEPLERFSWELLLFYIFALFSGILVVSTFNLGIKSYIFIKISIVLCLILSIGFSSFLQFQQFSLSIEIFLWSFNALITITILLAFILLVDIFIDYLSSKKIDKFKDVRFISVFISFLFLIIALSLFVPSFNKVYLLLVLSGMYIIPILITYLILMVKKKLKKISEEKE